MRKGARSERSGVDGTPPALGLARFSLLRNGEEVRIALLGEAMHTALMESYRMALFVQMPLNLEDRW
jgi:hypothetical protein